MDWFLGLNLGGKVLAVLLGGLLVFSVAYLIISGVLWLLFANPEKPASVGEAGRPDEASVLDEEFAAPPGMNLPVTRAECVGNTVEVEGR